MSYNYQELQGYQVDKTCSKCGEKNFMGTGYECSICGDFTWCESCFGKDQQSSRPHEHALKRTLCPLDAMALDVHTRWCDGCKTAAYPGRRYSCKRCTSLDYCEICWQNKIFDPRKRATPHTAACSFVYHEPPKKQARLNCFARALKMQNYFGLHLSTRNYDRLDCNYTSGMQKLAQKIGFAMFNTPSIVANELDSSFYLSKYGYKKQQEEIIEKLRSKCIELNGKHHSDKDIWINFVFVSYFEAEKFEGTLPLIKQAANGKAYFIEPSGRTYEGWEDFLDKNLLPECTIVYPSDGKYTIDTFNRTCTDFRKSAECDDSRQFCKVTDVTMTGVGLVGTAVGIVGLFTPLAPVAGAFLATSAVTAGGWGAGRAVHKLSDRASHEQSINPFSDKESFFCWLSIIGSTVSLGALGATGLVTSMAGKGVAIGSGVRALATTAIFGNLSVQAIGTIAGIINIIHKLETKEPITALEWFQVSASLLFFTNQVLNVKTAGAMVREIQNNKFDSVRQNLSPEEAKNLERLLAEDIYRAQHEGRVGGENVMRDIHQQQKNGNPLQFQDRAAGSTAGASTTANRHATQGGIDQLYLKNGKLLPVSTDTNNFVKTADAAARARSHGAILQKPGKQQTTTVFNISPQDLDAAVARNVKQGNTQLGGRNNLETVVTLKGEYPATNVRTRSVTGTGGSVSLTHEITETILIKNPSVVVDSNGKATHLFSNPQNNLGKFDPNAPGIQKVELIRSDAAGNKEYIYLNCSGVVTGKSRGEERCRDFDWYFENIG